ncbi:FkbM family methyltransferase [Candidatus Saccharibacteria bacterium]|nr:FkbM family methyltransferase [Candidatus Saccharibacteria bacterium]
MLNIHFYEQLQEIGAYEPELTSAMQAVIKPGMTVLDIGANLGYHSVLADRALQGSGKVYAFEPSSIVGELLKKNLADNNASCVEIVEVCISDTIGETVLHAVPISGFTSIIKQNAYGPQKHITRPCTTIDVFCQKRNISPDIIKMDIQGKEARAMEHATTIISKPGVQIFVEFWPKGLVEAGSDPKEFLMSYIHSGWHVHSLETNTVIKTERDYEDLLVSLRGIKPFTYVNLHMYKL